MFGARSPPLPSRPWQLAQVDANVCLPGSKTGSTVFWRGTCHWVCDQATKLLAAQRAASTPTNAQNDLGVASIDETVSLKHSREFAVANPTQASQQDLQPWLISRPLLANRYADKRTFIQ